MRHGSGSRNYCGCAHILQKWMVVQTFYNGVTQPARTMIDAATGGTLMSKTEEEAYNLIEEMALNNY